LPEDTIVDDNLYPFSWKSLALGYRYPFGSKKAERTVRLQVEKMKKVS
jgi:hypothetical protein